MQIIDEESVTMHVEDTNDAELDNSRDTMKAIREHADLAQSIKSEEPQTPTN
jgi:hypothetical protein